MCVYDVWRVFYIVPDEPYPKETDCYFFVFERRAMIWYTIFFKLFFKRVEKSECPFTTSNRWYLKFGFGDFVILIATLSAPPRSKDEIT